LQFASIITISIVHDGVDIDDSTTVGYYVQMQLYLFILVTLKQDE